VRKSIGENDRPVGESVESVLEASIALGAGRYSARNPPVSQDATGNERRARS